MTKFFLWEALEDFFKAILSDEKVGLGLTFSV